MPKEQLPYDIRLSDFHYNLPEERIASEPLKQRDQAKLLTYRAGKIHHQVFHELPDLLPENAMLLFNDTRVIRARLYFQRKTGAKIEVLLLHPVIPASVEEAMTAQGSCVWQCVIGNRKRWKEDESVQLLLPDGSLGQIFASLDDPDRNWVKFTWEPAEKSWVQYLAELGELPLPPYIKRKATDQDLIQYQTVYAKQQGAVAAPTAGLHFTPEVLEAVKDKGTKEEFVTLHVSAGTFLPVKSDRVMDHEMHAEQVIIRREQVQALKVHTGPIIPVGTTSLRWLESLYWLGHRLLMESDRPEPGHWVIEKEYPYQAGELPPVDDCLDAVLAYLDELGIDETFGDTRLLIVPGYPWRMTSGLITNYHMPGTTLILLVAALIGEDWRKVYQSAMDEGYRFLSYGDSSLLLPGLAEE